MKHIDHDTFYLEYCRRVLAGENPKWECANEGQNDWGLTPMGERPSMCKAVRYRLAQRKVKVGDREINAPLDVKPKHLERYFYIDGMGKVDVFLWRDDGYDLTFFNAGNCFATKEDAQAAADAWCALMKGEK